MVGTKRKNDGTSGIASQPPNGDRLQRRPLVPIFQDFRSYKDAAGIEGGENGQGRGFAV